jgi:hypothetical protein
MNPEPGPKRIADCFCRTVLLLEGYCVSVSLLVARAICVTLSAVFQFICFD